MGVLGGIWRALRRETLLTLPAPALPFCCATKESAALVLLPRADCGLAGLGWVSELACGVIEPPPQAASPRVRAASSSRLPLQKYDTSPPLRAECSRGKRRPCEYQECPALPGLAFTCLKLT